MPQTVKALKFGKCKRIAANHKPTKEKTQGTSYTHLLGQDHKPPMHLTLVQYSMDAVNGKRLWRMSVCTHFEPNTASIVQKFTPSITLSLASDNFLCSEKKN